MNKLLVTYWQDNEYWLGYLNDYPEYQTQGLSLEELVENLKDIYHDITNELIPGLRKSMELEIA